MTDLRPQTCISTSLVFSHSSCASNFIFFFFTFNFSAILLYSWPKTVLLFLLITDISVLKRLSFFFCLRHTAWFCYNKVIVLNGKVPTKARKHWRTAPSRRGTTREITLLRKGHVCFFTNKSVLHRHNTSWCLEKCGAIRN